MWLLTRVAVKMGIYPDLPEVTQYYSALMLILQTPNPTGRRLGSEDAWSLAEDGLTLDAVGQQDHPVAMYPVSEC